ncbi:MAG: hypothetical protein IJ933_09685 [Bacteroidales bacterium]|nr:hypothetical protein [Bacteroidales bacterium]
MKAKHLIPLALCALLAACTSGGNNQQPTAQTADTAKQAAAPEKPQQTTTPEPKKDAPQVDIAQNVLKLIDKKLLELDKTSFQSPLPTTTKPSTKNAYSTSTHRRSSST